jgi:hypothetical protein
MSIVGPTARTALKLGEIGVLERAQRVGANITAVDKEKLK